MVIFELFPCLKEQLPQGTETLAIADRAYVRPSRIRGAYLGMYGGKADV